MAFPTTDLPTHAPSIHRWWLDHAHILKIHPDKDNKKELPGPRNPPPAPFHTTSNTSPRSPGTWRQRGLGARQSGATRRSCRASSIGESLPFFLLRFDLPSLTRGSLHCATPPRARPELQRAKRSRPILKIFPSHFDRIGMWPEVRLRQGYRFLVAIRNKVVAICGKNPIATRPILKRVGVPIQKTPKKSG